MAGTMVGQWAGLKALRSGYLRVASMVDCWVRLLVNQKAVWWVDQ